MTKPKPNTTSDMVVVDVIFGEPGFCAKFGWEMELDDHYSPHLKSAFTREEYKHFVNEANQVLKASKLQSGGCLSNCCILLTCCLPLLCLRCSVNGAAERALGELQVVIKKWNNKLADKNCAASIRLQCYKRAPMKSSEVRGGVTGHMDSVERLAACDYEAWIEIELA